jgi:hypothetical protein
MGRWGQFGGIFSVPIDYEGKGIFEVEPETPREAPEVPGVSASQARAWLAHLTELAHRGLG